MKPEEIFESAIAPKDIPGSALILLHGDKNLIHTVGTPDKHDPDARVHAGTVFQIGSVTKVFTALLAAGLVVKNALQLKVTVGDILPGERMDNSISGINILQLLTHTSGLPRLPDNFIGYCSRKQDPYANYGENELLEYLGGAKVKAGCKTVIYSNLGYGLLGYLLGKVARMPYAQLLRERLCIPLGLGDTCIYTGQTGGPARADAAGPPNAAAGPDAANAAGPPDNGEYAPIAKGYTEAGDEAPLWNMNILSGAAGILSTPQDILAFLKAVVLGNSILEESIRKSLESLNKSMAWGWFMKDGILQLLNGTDALWHNGMTGGFASYIEISRKERKGLAVLFNKATYADFVGSAIQGKY